MTSFTHKGVHVHLTLEQLATGSVCCAAAKEREVLHLITRKATDDVDEIIHRVTDWLDDGMPETPSDTRNGRA